jgi:dihydrofolate reductase
MGGVVIMGRRTFESLPPGTDGKPRPLPGRTNIVLTRKGDYAPAGVTVARSVDDLLSVTECGADHVYVCGGSEIYRLLMPYTDSCLVTRVDASFGADTFFPNLDTEIFTGQSGEMRRYILANQSDPVTEKDMEGGGMVTYRFLEYRSVTKY